MSNFEVQAGNARLYKLTEEKRQKELARLKGLRETGQAWATDDQCHDYDGFIKIDQQVIDYLSFSLEHGQDRINWKGKIAKKLDGSRMLKIGDLWVSGGEVPSLKKFKDSVPPSAPAKPPTEAVKPPTEAVKPPTEAVVTEDFDDDIPF